MRKCFAMGAAGVCLLARLASGQSLLNYGFENGSPAPWYVAYVGTGSGTVGNASAHTGNYGLTFGPNNGDELAYQDISGLVPGQTYVVSAWVKATAPTGNRITLAVATPQGYNWSQAPVMTPGAGWQEISQAYTATAGGTARIILYQLSGSQTTYWDDITVTPLPPQNAGFESGTLGPWSPVYVATGSATVSTAARSGNSGLTFGANPGGDELVFQDISGLAPGQTYLVSAWVKAPTAAGNSALLAITPSQGADWAIAPVVTPNPNWQQISQTYTVTSTGALRILLYQLAGSQSTSWDDVTVIPVPPRNAGFETGALGGWTQGYVGTGSAAVGNTAHWGSDGLVFGPNSGDELVYQDITGLVPGQTYLLSAWVKGAANSGNSVTVAATTQEPGNAWAVAPHVTPTTSWQPITEPYTVTSTGGMRFLLYQLGGSQNTYWDDVLITPLPPVNAGFENGALWPWNASFVTTGSAALSGVAHWGGYGMAFGPNPTGDAILFQDITGLAAGQTYTVAAWVKAAAATGNSVTIAATTPQAGNPWVVAPHLTPTTSWQQISLTYTATASGTMRLHLYQLAGSQTTYWDDVTLTGGSFTGTVLQNFSTSFASVWGNFTVQQSYGSASLTPAAPRKEYVYLGGKLAAIENPGP